MSHNKKYLIVIGGPTASGKTDMAIEVAQVLGAEIISADSRQIYMEMNIGTAKPSKEELSKVSHHLIDHINISQEYSVGQYEREAMEIIERLYDKSNIAILSGGTGLYIKAVVEGVDIFPQVPDQIKNHLIEQHQSQGLESLVKELKEKDPSYASQVDLNNPHRLIRALSVIRASGQPFSSFMKKSKVTRPFVPILICLDHPREVLYDRINRRVDQMIEAGLVDEVISLRDYQSLNSLNTVGYKEIFKYLDGDWTLDMAISKIKQHTRNYAKRQVTWFKNQQDYQSFSPGDTTEILAYIKSCLS